MRARTMQIVAPLEIEDYVIQTAEFMSPPRWHIGHTSWFFETLLQAYQPGYKVYSEEYLFYFNSYYEGFGARIERPKRGTRSRPTVKDTVAYRKHVDEQMLAFLESIENNPKRKRFCRSSGSASNTRCSIRNCWFTTSSTCSAISLTRRSNLRPSPSIESRRNG